MTSNTPNRNLAKEDGTDDPGAFPARYDANLDILDTHTHPATDITTGVIPIARLATGTPTGSKFIRDDGTLQVPAGGGTPAAVDVTNTPAGNIAATNVQAALNELDTEKSATGHTHPASDIASGTVAAARLGSGSATANTVLHGDQSWGGVNASTQISSGTVPAARLGSGSPSSSTVLDGTNAWRALTTSDIASGTMGTARLGSGVADATKFLRGDSSWVATPGLPAGGTTNQGLLKNSATDGDASFKDVVTPTSHDTLDHTAALATASIVDLADVTFTTGPATGDTLINSSLGWVNTPTAFIASSAKCDPKRSTGGAITSGQAILTRTGGDTFTSTGVDAGKTVFIPGAGAAGADLITTISTVTNSTTAVLAANASTTVSGKIVFWGTDDRAQIAADIAALPTNGGTLVLAGPAICNGELSLAGKRNVRIAGRGGYTGRSFTSTSGYNLGLPPSGLIYIKSGAATFLNCAQSQAVELVNIGVHYVNAGYTGILIDLEGHATDTDLRCVRPLLADCTVGALIDGLTGCVLVNDTYAWKPVYRRTTFVGGNYQIVCSAAGYVNSRSCEDCSWGLYGVAAVYNPGEAMSVTGGFVERNWNATVASRVGAFLQCEASTAFDGCSVVGTWFSDVNNGAAASSWFDLKPGATNGGGLVASGCRMGGGTNQTFAKVTATGFKGIKITGGSAPYNGKLLDVNSQTNVTGQIDQGTIALGAGITVLAGASGAGTRIGGVWQTFIPTLQAGTTDPTLGTSPTIECQYFLDGNQKVTAQYMIRFGTSAAAGSGTYFLNLPITATTSLGNGVAAKLGHASLGDDSAFSHAEASVHCTAGTTFTGVTADGDHAYIVPTGGLSASNTFPWTWADRDNIHLTLEYQAS